MSTTIRCARAMGTVSALAAVLSNPAAANFVINSTDSSNYGCQLDLDGDGDVDGVDLASLLAAWGSCPQ